MYFGVNYNFCVSLLSSVYLCTSHLPPTASTAELIDNHHRMVALNDEIKAGPCVQVLHGESMFIYSFALMHNLCAIALDNCSVLYIMCIVLCFHLQLNWHTHFEIMF